MALPLRLLLAAAAVLGLADGAGVATHAAISAGAQIAYSPAKARLFATLSKLAYCSSDIGGNWSCGAPCRSAGFEEVAGAKPVLVSPPASNGTKGLEAVASAAVVPLAVRGVVDPASGQPVRACVVSFRGVEAWEQPLKGLDMALTPWQTAAGGAPGCLPGQGCQVAASFAGAWSVLKQGVVAALEESSCDHSSYVFVTGHSLGAAVATLAMFSLRDMGYLHLQTSYAFGGPKVGNAAFAMAFNLILPVPLFMVTHENDEVPRFPDSAAYAAAGFQAWYSGTTAQDYTICGSFLADPTCGILNIPRGMLCPVNPAVECKTQACEDPKCGTAPQGGPHCHNLLAPADNFCQGTRAAGQASSSKGPPAAEKDVYPPELSAKEAAATAKVQKTNGHGRSSDLSSAATLVVAPPSTPIVPPQELELAPAPQAAPPSAKNLSANASLEERFAASGLVLLKPCFAANASFAGDLYGSTPTLQPNATACQALCRETDHCAVFSYFPEMETCHLGGAWAMLSRGIVGAVAGPVSCSKLVGHAWTPDTAAQALNQSLAQMLEVQRKHGAQTGLNQSLSVPAPINISLPKHTLPLPAVTVRLPGTRIVRPEVLRDANYTLVDLNLSSPGVTLPKVILMNGTYWHEGAKVMPNYTMLEPSVILPGESIPKVVIMNGTLWHEGAIPLPPNMTMPNVTLEAPNLTQPIVPPPLPTNVTEPNLTVPAPINISLPKHPLPLPAVTVRLPGTRIVRPEVLRDANYTLVDLNLSSPGMTLPKVILMNGTYWHEGARVARNYTMLELELGGESIPKVVIMNGTLWHEGAIPLPPNMTMPNITLEAPNLTQPIVPPPLPTNVTEPHLTVPAPINISLPKHPLPLPAVTVRLPGTRIVRPEVLRDANYTLVDLNLSSPGVTLPKVILMNGTYWHEGAKVARNYTMLELELGDESIPKVVIMNGTLWHEGAPRIPRPLPTYVRHTTSAPSVLQLTTATLPSTSPSVPVSLTMGTMPDWVKNEVPGVATSVTDATALVPPLAPAGQLTLTDVAPCFAGNMSFSPTDMYGYQPIVQESALACQQLCNRTEACKVFTYMPWDGTCHLNGEWAVSSPSPGTIAGPVDCQHPFGQDWTPKAAAEANRKELKHMQKVQAAALNAAAPAAKFLDGRVRAASWRGQAPALSTALLACGAVAMLAYSADRLRRRLLGNGRMRMARLYGTVEGEDLWVSEATSRELLLQA